ncbi:signal peptidase II [Alicyclobacillus fastidiosus]|uniref:Lipoprotein signal peptidase n=1 Tax=Alicyclobacillus fastidiosus TaxID=392011 RepID=A0ABY6ZD19_9BACL|nr:signal peptidase II [Alicyclobacillus fastidiosus]WAH40417.1 signal peptidase II [Alicyclobacillus fastidiosus]GMA61814.1 lipoprotein signal peptidase [Alicyclobacillus fastidiosus]
MLYIVAALIYVLDQLVKWLIRANLPVFHAVTIIPDVVEFLHIQNTGGAFSIFPNQIWLFVLVAVFVVVAVVVIERKYRPGKLAQVGLGLLLGGAVGNMTDRIIHHSVTDYVYFSIVHFAIFNLADAAIDVGVLLLLINSFRSPKNTKTETKEDVES